MHNPGNTIQEKIQGLQSLPADARFSAGRTWEHLETKLQQQRPGRRSWLRFAAVFILLAGIAVVFLLNDRPVNKPLTATTQTSNAFAVDEHSKQEIVVDRNQNTATAPASITNPVTKKEVQPEHYPAVATGNMQQPALDTIIEPIPLIQQPVAVSVTTVIPVNHPASASIVKKKLRVVHLNDLYQPRPSDVVAAETKKQQAEELTEPETITQPSPKPFWKNKAATRITISPDNNR